MKENFKYRVELYCGKKKIEDEEYDYIKDRKLFYNENQARVHYDELLNSRKKDEKLRFYKRISNKWTMIEEV